MIEIVLFRCIVNQTMWQFNALNHVIISTMFDINSTLVFVNVQGPVFCCATIKCNNCIKCAVSLVWKLIWKKSLSFIYTLSKPSWSNNKQIDNCIKAGSVIRKWNFSWVCNGSLQSVVILRCTMYIIHTCTQLHPVYVRIWNVNMLLLLHIALLSKSASSRNTLEKNHFTAEFHLKSSSSECLEFMEPCG